MYELFENRYRITNSITLPPEFNFLRRTYLRELDTIRKYYYRSSFHLDSTNILVRILTIFNVPLEVPILRFAEIVNARSPVIAQHFRMTSDIAYGSIHTNSFYGPDIPEIWLFNNDGLDIFKLEGTDWRLHSAIEVLDHPVSDLGLLVPNGSRISTAEGLSSIYINLPLLLYQYRMFCLTAKDASTTTINVFLTRYILPRILYTHIDMVIMNRAMNIFYGAPMSATVGKHTFPIVNYASKIDGVLEKIIKRLSRTQMSVQGYMDNIPGIYKQNASEFIIMPDFAKTRQSWWALVVTRLRLIKFLIDLSKASSTTNNRDVINKIKIDLARVRSTAILNKDINYNITSIIEDIIAL